MASENHPIDGLMSSAMNSIKEMVDVNTIIGEPIETSKLKESVKEWYKKAFEDDDLADRIDEKVTFEDIKNNPEKVYDLVGVNDSLVRERIFIEISDRQGKDYDEIYQEWLGNKKKENKRNVIPALKGNFKEERGGRSEIQSGKNGIDSP